VRVCGHDQIVADQGEDQGKGQQVEDAENGHAAGQALFVRWMLIPASQQPTAEGTRGATVFQGEVEPMVQKGQAEAIQQAQPEKVPTEHERHVEPHLLAVQVFVKPGKDVLLAEKEDDEQDQGDREEGGEGFGHVCQRPAPAGFYRVHEGREEHGTLGDGREKQES
jgi:hypothetical protein